MATFEREEDHEGNGSEERWSRRGDGDIVGDARRVAGDARRVAEDASSMLRNARRVGSDLRQIIADQPLRALGAAAGVGFVLGGGLSPTLLRSATGIAGRLAMVVLTRRAIAMLDDRVNGGAASDAGPAASNQDWEGDV